MGASEIAIFCSQRVAVRRLHCAGIWEGREGKRSCLDREQAQDPGLAFRHPSSLGFEVKEDRVLGCSLFLFECCCFVVVVFVFVFNLLFVVVLVVAGYVCVCGKKGRNRLPHFFSFFLQVVYYYYIYLFLTQNSTTSFTHELCLLV